MATTTANNNAYPTDPNGNEISWGGKFFSGILLIVATLAAVVALIAHWPDKLPPIDGATKYHYKLFGITYLGAKGVPVNDTSITVFPKRSAEQAADTIKKTADTLNSSEVKKATDTNDTNKMAHIKKWKRCTIDLNTLLLLLVAIAGFLGNLIHISASFTNFIGAGKFKRSWTLWYFVKPFTAAALAIGVYIIFRAGFLNSSEASASVNLYGVVAMAFFAGLFTDKATDKLKEVFGVIFQSSMARPNPLETTHNPATTITVADITPASLVANASTTINISGTGLDAAGLVVKVGEKPIAEADLTKTATNISFSHTATQAGDLVVALLNDKGETVGTKTLTVTAAGQGLGI